MIAALRWGFIALLVAHGVAHLQGFAISWRLLTSPDLPYHTAILDGRIDIGGAGIRALGLVWLSLAAAFVVAAILVAVRGRWAFAAVVAAALVSLLLCAVEWPFSRVGVGVNLTLLVLLPLMAQLSWAEQTSLAVAALSNRRVPLAPAAVDAMAALPPIVARYFTRSLGADPRRIISAVYRQDAEFLIGERWRPLTATQFVRADVPGFVWDARIGLAPGVAAFVRDSYVNGRGAMRAEALALIPMVAQQGNPALDSGALHRYLAELVWMPSALLPSLTIHWTPLSDRAARVTLVDGHTTVALDFRFNDDGEVTEIFTAERFAERDGTYCPEPWLVRCRDYQVFDGVRVPGYCDVSWVTPQGPAPYWRGRIVSARYESEAASAAAVSADIRRNSTHREFSASTRKNL